MDNASAPQGAAGGQPQDVTARFVKVGHIKSLNNVPEATKAKWISMIGNFATIIQTAAPDSQPYKEAWSGWTALTKMAVESSKQAKNNQQNSRPQGGAQGGAHQQGQQQSQAQAQGQGNQANTVQRPPAWPPAIDKHLRETTLYPPPGISMGTPTYETWLAAQKDKYGMMLYTSEMHKVTGTKISNQLKMLRDKGQDLPQQLIAEAKRSSEAFNAAKAKLEQFRADQLKNKANLANMQQQGQQQQQQAGQQQGQQQDTNRSEPPSATMPQQPFNLKLPGHPNQLPTTQNQQSGMNPSVEAARNQNRNSMSPTQQHTPHMGQAQASFQQQQQQQYQGNNTMGQHQQHPMNANQPQRPSLNTQQPMNAMPHQQNGAGGNNNGPPQPLTHNQAIQNAARSHSERPTPQIMPPNNLGQTHGSYSNQGGQGQQTPNREHSNVPSTAPKISKNLPPHLYAPPPAVNFPSARPTLSGPSNGVGGMMGQPAIAKPPPFQLDGDQASGVLSKKKLDELVRQVTGGGEAMNRETLTPEVEEAMLMLADEFVDNVITAACRLAKIRESQTLDIKDIQLILERNYGIRIPGYASDEIRAIKKYAPAPGWTQKMNAIQASKVMGGKADI